MWCRMASLNAHKTILNTAHEPHKSWIDIE